MCFYRPIKRRQSSTKRKGADNTLRTRRPATAIDVTPSWVLVHGTTTCHVNVSHDGYSAIDFRHQLPFDFVRQIGRCPAVSWVTDIFQTQEQERTRARLYTDTGLSFSGLQAPCTDFSETRLLFTFSSSLSSVLSSPILPSLFPFRLPFYPLLSLPSLSFSFSRAHPINSARRFGEHCKLSSRYGRPRCPAAK